MTDRSSRSTLHRLALGIAALMLAGASQPPVVKTEGGAVKGAVVDEGKALVFRGIPFAAPPIKERRWKPPFPAASWTGVREAIAPAPACPQNDYGWNRADFRFSQEDCLTLDIRTPALTGKRPVIVWIHGGSNRAGSPGDMVKSDITQRDVVLVAIRYRLGIFGFLSHRGLTAEGNGASGNYGLMDQVAALRWIQQNIARFGGNPSNVTIVGESAGSQDVGLLLASPDAQGLFAKAVMQSGTPGFGLPFRPLTEAHRIGDQADALLETGGSVEKLRAASVPALLAADLKLHDNALESDDYMWLRTTIDGAVLPASPRDLLAKAPPRPVIIGSNRRELELPGGRPRRDAFVAKAFAERERDARAFYRLDEPEPPAHPRLGTLSEQIATDVTFRCPAINLAALLASHAYPVWHYEFDHAPDGGQTFHGADISYVFTNRNFASGLSLQAYWVQFARTGNPNGPGLPAWPAYAPDKRMHVAFDASGATALGPLRPQPCSLMERL